MPCLVLAHGLEHILHGDVLSIQSTRKNRSTVDEYGRRVQPDHRHHHSRQRLVASRETDDRIVAMTAHGKFNRIRDRLTGRE